MTTPTFPAELLINNQSAHGEGPIWDPASETLFWVDMTGHKLHSLQPAGDTSATHSFSEAVCAVTPLGNNRLLIALAKRLAFFDLTSSALDEICPVEPHLAGNRCNDGKMDPAGRFWIGTMSANGPYAGAGSLYRLDEGKTLTKVLDGLTVSNGMDWTPDGRTMYFTDSAERAIWAFDFNPRDSSISNRRTVVKVPEELGLPDGFTLGADGTLWVAHWGAGCVCQWDPRDGRLLRRITTGCPHTTSCYFGGPARDTLYITTSRLGLDEEALRVSPHSGGLFRWQNQRNAGKMPTLPSSQ